MDKQQKYKIIHLIVAIASLVIFFVWGWLEGTFAHSWIIFIVAGCVFAVLGVLRKNDNNG